MFRLLRMCAEHARISRAGGCCVHTGAWPVQPACKLRLLLRCSAELCTAAVRRAARAPPLSAAGYLTQLPDSPAAPPSPSS